MFNLFLRTFSQGMQAFIPVAVAWTWFRRRNPGVASAIGLGVLASMPISAVAAWLFAASTRKAFDEWMLASCALAIASVFLAAVWRPRAGPEHAGHPHGGAALAALVPGLPAVIVAIATVLIIARQTMEIGATFGTAFFELRSLEATRAVLTGAGLAALIAAAWAWLGRHAADHRLSSATQSFAVLFVVQVLVYAVHEASEAHLLPFADIIHTASEPYGPDGVYGLHFSELLVIVPLMAALVARPLLPRMACLILPVCLLVSSSVAPGTTPGVLAAGADPATLTRQPHILFRDTTPGSAFGTLSVVALTAPEEERASTGLSCERVAFNAGRGICLHAESTFFGLFTGYSAIFVDAALKPFGAAMKLEGRPSRTRVAADGRAGAYTVFVIGDAYSTDFSTRTVLVDMASGSRIADLEEFAVSRSGERFSARDFNFWGVTFARDGDTFYASLRTGGKTYLVRGALAARTVTVLRDNVECPSLSPDGRRVAFKRFVGPDPGAWRIATLDLATMQERFVSGETRYIDDQVEWLDSERILYAVPRRTTSSSDVWVASVDGDTPARVFLPQAESPIVVR